MTIASAKTFIRTGMTDHELRRQLNQTADIKGLKKVLSEKEYSFSVHEFEEAFNTILFQCQFEEDAQRLSEFKLWWDFLVITIEQQSRKKGNS